MTLPGPLRAAGIILCIVMIAAPSIACFRVVPAGALKAMDFLHVLLPFWLLVLVHLCIDAGRRLERAERERVDRG